jgi:hypothetical protein
LDHGLAAEDDVRGPDDLGAARDLVSRVLLRGVEVSPGVLRFEGGDGSVRIGKFGGCRENGKRVELTVSMYSPFAGFLDIVATWQGCFVCVDVEARDNHIRSAKVWSRVVTMVHRGQIFRWYI